MAGIWDGVLAGPGGSEGTWERLSLLPEGLDPTTRLCFFGRGGSSSWCSAPLCAKEDAAKTARDNLENYSRSYAAWLVSSPQRWPRAGVMSLRDRWLPKAPAWGARPEIPGGEGSRRGGDAGERDEQLRAAPAARGLMGMEDGGPRSVPAELPGPLPRALAPSRPPAPPVTRAASPRCYFSRWGQIGLQSQGDAYQSPPATSSPCHLLCHVPVSRAGHHW